MDEKKFAEAMVADHTKTSSELKGLVGGEMKAAIPTALDDSSQKKLDKLRDAKVVTRRAQRSLSSWPR